MTTGCETECSSHYALSSEKTSADSFTATLATRWPPVNQPRASRAGRRRLRTTFHTSLRPKKTRCEDEMHVLQDVSDEVRDVFFVLDNESIEVGAPIWVADHEMDGVRDVFFVQCETLKKAQYQ